MPLSRFEHGFVEALFGSDELGLGLVDTDLRYIRVNDTLARINGVPAADHMGRTVRDIVPEFADLAESVLHRVIESRRPVIALEIEGPPPAEGEPQAYFRVSFFPIEEDGRVIGVAALILDVTARVETERELKQQARQIYENLLQDFAIAQLALDEGERDRAYDAIVRGLAQAKAIATKALLDEILPDE